MQVGGHGVLFAADGDAVTHEAAPSHEADRLADRLEADRLARHPRAGPVPVEIKCSNPLNWKRKVPLQMTSSGATVLLYGLKQNAAHGEGRTCSKGNMFGKPPLLVDVGTKSLTDMFCRAGGFTSWGYSQDRIIAGLDAIAEKAARLPEGHVAEVVFTKDNLSELHLKLVTDGSASLLPPTDVVRTLLFADG